MKNLICAFLLLCFSIPLSAQTDTLTYRRFERKNIVRANLTSSIVKAWGISYERTFSQRWSANLSLSYKPAKDLSSIFDLSGNGMSLKGSPEFGGFYITPEVRWYCDGRDVRRAPRGFYLGPYYRYGETYLKTNIHYVDDQNDLNADMKFTLREHGIGVNVGYQLLAIKERLVLDFIFAGPRISSYTLVSEASSDLNGEFYEQLAENINDKLGFGFLDPDLDLDNKKKQEVRSTSLGFRYAIRIGFAF